MEDDFNEYNEGYRDDAEEFEQDALAHDMEHEDPLDFDYDGETPLGQEIDGGGELE